MWSFRGSGFKVAGVGSCLLYFACCCGGAKLLPRQFVTRLHLRVELRFGLELGGVLLGVSWGSGKGKKGLEQLSGP